MINTYEIKMIPHSHTLLIMQRQLEKMLTEQVMSMLRPRRLKLLCKSERFELVNNVKEKKSRRKCVSLFCSVLFCSLSLLFPS